ncbi:hypothetical protein CRE_02101 [Caenorhabditis remanei]|uniref:C2H2-type domain-containing protein n=1 Tax=Caenorhabditis remanei TaxID=31234 RepID=E3LF09_CAERE|nr:hypothetical protein CRE_02101 [Caenorhabditis remanei]
MTDASTSANPRTTRLQQPIQPVTPTTSSMGYPQSRPGPFAVFAPGTNALHPTLPFPYWSPQPFGQSIGNNAMSLYGLQPSPPQPGSSKPTTSTPSPHLPNTQLAIPNGSNTGMMSSMMNTPPGMGAQSSMDNTIRTILAFQARENAIFHQDMQKRQTDLNKMMIDVTKMLIEEQQATRAFHREFLETFSKSMAGLIPNTPLPVNPATPSPPPKPSVHQQQATPSPAATDIHEEKPQLLATHKRVSPRTVIEKQQNEPPKKRNRKTLPRITVMLNRKLIGKGRLYDEAAGDFAVFDCKFCGELSSSRDELIQHSQRYHPRG